MSARDAVRWPAPPGGDAGETSDFALRRMHRVVIGLGSNVDPRRNIDLARRRIAGAMRVLAESPCRDTAPVGDPSQPAFVNGAMLVETTMEPSELKAWLRDVEAALGRPRTGDRSGPRTIDLDILVWDGELIDPDVRRRKFLQESIRDVLSEWRLD